MGCSVVLRVPPATDVMVHPVPTSKGMRRLIPGLEKRETWGTRHVVANEFSEYLIIA